VWTPSLGPYRVVIDIGRANATIPRMEEVGGGTRGGVGSSGDGVSEGERRWGRGGRGEARRAASWWRGRVGFE
jgi:hypothetical protein